MSILDHIVDASIRDMTDYMNDPDLEIVLDNNDAMPDFRNVVHTRYGSCVFGESNGVSRFIYHNGDGKNHGGFGGSVYRKPILHEDGSIDMMSFGGPWSGSVTETNVRVPDYWWVDVITFIPRYKHTGLAGYNLRLDIAVEVVDRYLPEWELYAAIGWEGNTPARVYIIPKRKGEAPKNPSQYDISIPELIKRTSALKNLSPPSGSRSSGLSSEQAFAVYGGAR